MVQLDMGTSLKGLTVAADKGAFKGLYSQTDFASTNYTLAGFVLADMIPVYLVTHPHLDHTAGLVISAPADTPQKAILGTDFTIDHLQNDLFNWGTWPNFAKMGEGVAPLGIYNLVKIVDNGNTVYDIPSAHVDIKAFPLVHGDNPSTNPPSSYPSTAYLVSTTPTGSTTARLLFFGDTGADSVQGVGNMADIWAEVAPYVVDETLQVIMLECSYANSQPSDQLFGHLNPTYFMEEMDNLLTAVWDFFIFLFFYFFIFYFLFFIFYFLFFIFYFLFFIFYFLFFIFYFLFFIFYFLFFIFYFLFFIFYFLFFIFYFLFFIFYFLFFIFYFLFFIFYFLFFIFYFLFFIFYFLFFIFYFLFFIFYFLFFIFCFINHQPLPPKRSKTSPPSAPTPPLSCANSKSSSSTSNPPPSSNILPNQHGKPS